MKTPINLSFTNSFSFPEVELASDTLTDKEVILDQLVVKKYQYRKFVTNNRRVPGAPLPPIITRKAAPVIAHHVNLIARPSKKTIRKAIPKIELSMITEKLIPTTVKVARPVEVYSTLEHETTNSDINVSLDSNTPAVVEAPKAEDEYSKMQSLRNTFVASLIGDMSEMTIQSDELDFPVINEIFNEEISLPKAHPVVKAKAFTKKKQLIAKPTQLVKKVIRRRIVKAPAHSAKVIKKVEVAQPVVIKPSESEQLLQMAEVHLKQEVKSAEYSKPEVVSTHEKITPVALTKSVDVKPELPVIQVQPVIQAVAKVKEVSVVKPETKKDEVSVVIDSPKVEVTEEYLAPSIPVVQDDPQVVQEPKPEPQVQAIAAPLIVTGAPEAKKEVEPVVVARAWTLAPPVITKAPAKETLIVTIKPNNTTPPPTTPEPKKEKSLPLDPVANVAGLVRTNEPVKEEVALDVEPDMPIGPEPVIGYVPPAPVPEPIQVVEKVCKQGVCFDRWLSKNSEQLDVLTYSLNKIPTQPNAKEWLLTNEERSVPTLYYGANLGNIPLINKSELEQTVKNIDGEGFLLIRNHPNWALVGSTSLLEENTISNSDRAPGDKLYTKVQPGMLLVKVKNNETKKLAAVAIPIMRGHISFLDFTKAEEKTATVSLDKPSAQMLGIEWVGTEVLSGVKSGQTVSSVKIQTFGNYPINVDVRASDGFSHRHLVFPNNNQVKLRVDILKDRQVERFLKMLEGGVSSDSGMVYGKIPLQFIGNNVRLDPGRASKKLIPELYFFDGNLSDEEQILIPTAQASAKIRNMVGVQVPKGLLLISLEKPSGDRQSVQLHLSQPGVINVYQPE
ncbi:MAG: hypothetical protein KA715_01695 [Xanthomonadaceae bacterium]|nr:hypothetical protein [Xanthomonadaceae bacterium]